MDPLKRGRSRVESLVAVAAIFVVTLAVNLQLPLYKSYADASGYGQGLVSVTFAAYVVGLLPTLLLLGGVTNRLGSKLALASGLVSALLAHAVIIAHPTMRALLVTRLFQGVSMGLSLPAATAALAELGDDPQRVARLSGAAVTLGLGSGGLLTSATLSAEPGAAPKSYTAVALATVACLAAVLRYRGAPADSRGSFVRMPLISRRTLPFAVAIFVSWSMTGVILATIPTELARTGRGSWSGLVVFVAIALGALIQLGPELRDARRSLRIGYALVSAAFVLLIIAVREGSTSLLFGAAALSSFSGFGFTYLGGLAGTLAACPEERAPAVAGYYLAGYLGLGGPCIAVGYLTDRFGLAPALGAYAAAIALTMVVRHVVRGLQRRAAIACAAPLSAPALASRPSESARD